MYEKYDKKSEALIVAVSLVVISVLTVVISYYFHPQEETLMCDKNYNCKFTRSYLGFIIYKKNIKFSKNTLFIPISKGHYVSKGKYDMHVEGLEYHYNFVENGKTVVKFNNYFYTGNEQNFKIVYNNEKEKFENYVNNPKISNYKVSNSINLKDIDTTSKRILWFTVSCIFGLMILSAIINSISSFIKKKR